MAKKQEVKTTKKDIIDKTIKTVEYAIAPLTAILAIWNIDASNLYCSRYWCYCIYFDFC